MGLAGILGVAHTIAYATRAVFPESAHALAPWDGRITALVSEKLSAATATKGERAQSDQLARAALRQDPTAIAAWATLVINAQVRDETASARRLFAHADHISRRDLRLQLWAIEDAVARNDVPAALHHYDVAMRTSRAAPTLLFPVLNGAISDVEIRRRLIPILVTWPTWAEGALGYIAGKSEDAAAISNLFIDLSRRRVPVPANVTAAAVERLISLKHFDDAWAYYSQLTSHVDRRTSRDDGFSANLANPTPFDWRPVTDNPGVSASVQHIGKGGRFDFAVSPTVSGAVLQQLQVLPPGEYVIMGVSAGVSQPAKTQPFWTLNCFDGRILGVGEVTSSATAQGRFAGRFSVPAACPAQMLSLVVRATDDLGGVTGQILQVKLRPVTN